MKKKTKEARKTKAKQELREFVSVRHEYTQAERNLITDDLTRALQQCAEQEEQLKSVSADFKARIKTGKAKVSEATNKLTNGYEMRQVDATVQFDRKLGRKKFFFHAPGNRELHKKLIREEDMTAADYERLPLDLPPAEKPRRGKEPPVSGEPTGDPLVEAKNLEEMMTQNQIPPPNEDGAQE